MKSEKKLVPVSIILTVKNDAKALQMTLDALAEQTAKPTEVILLVAKSDDETLSVARNWHLDGTKILAKEVDQATRSQGRNQGAKLASQPILVFTDAGCLPDPGWLEALTAPFTALQTKVVSGFTDGDKSSLFYEAQIPFILVPFNKIGLHPLPATRNMAIRKSAFLENKGFREDLNYAEDYEFSRRLQAKGVRSVFAPGAKVVWRPRQSTWRFFAMIEKLTKGDIQANTLRFGHLSMILRYLFFLAVFVVGAQIFGKQAGIFSFVVLYICYLGLKLMTFHFENPKAYFFAPVLQILADLAVLCGILDGMMSELILKAKPA